MPQKQPRKSNGKRPAPEPVTTQAEVASAAVVKDLERLNVEAPKPGRPTEYDPSYNEEAFGLCLLGAVDAELAEHFGIAQSTLYEWKNRHPEFAEAIKRGKHPADAIVAGSLFQRAQGYEWDEAVPIKVKEVIYENGKRLKETERIETVMVHKVVPPDPTSMIFWLKNRRRGDWKDKQEIGFDGDSPLVIRVVNE